MVPRRPEFPGFMFDINALVKSTVQLGSNTKVGADCVSSARSDLSRGRGVTRVPCTLPIRLTQTPTKCRVHPVSRVELGKSWRFCTTRDAEQGTEGIEWVEAPIEAERKLVEVGL